MSSALHYLSCSIPGIDTLFGFCYAGSCLRIGESLSKYGIDQLAKAYCRKACSAVCRWRGLGQRRVYKHGPSAGQKGIKLELSLRDTIVSYSLRHSISTMVSCFWTALGCNMRVINVRVLLPVRIASIQQYSDIAVWAIPYIYEHTHLKSAVLLALHSRFPHLLASSCRSQDPSVYIFPALPSSRTDSSIRIHPLTVYCTRSTSRRSLRLSPSLRRPFRPTSSSEQRLCSSLIEPPPRKPHAQRQ